MDQVQQAIEPCKEFVKDSVRLVKRCTKPDRKGNVLHLHKLVNEETFLRSARS